MRRFFKECQRSVFHVIYSLYDISNSGEMENPNILVHRAGR